jgi:small subunit ribosomal protein S16
MQRTGRKGYASFRVVVQDSRFSPSSGRVVAKIGHYNPHTKEVVLDKVAAAEYLQNGAQPSPRVTKLLVLEKVQLPDWVKQAELNKSKKIRNPEKLRKNQPKEEVIPEETPVVDADTPEEVIAEEIVEQLAEIEEEIVAEEIAEVLVEEEAIAEAEAEIEAEDKSAPA